MIELNNHLACGTYFEKDIIRFCIDHSYSTLDNDLVMYCTQRFTQNHLQYPPIDKMTVEEKDVMLHLLLKSSFRFFFVRINLKLLKRVVGDILV